VSNDTQGFYIEEAMGTVQQYDYIRAIFYVSMEDYGEDDDGYENNFGLADNEYPFKVGLVAFKEGASKYNLDSARTLFSLGGMLFSLWMCRQWLARSSQCSSSSLAATWSLERRLIAGTPQLAWAYHSFLKENWQENHESSL
jgi:hypothetical protein